MKINIGGLSQVLKKNKTALKIFTKGIVIVLYILEQQRLVDKRKLEKVTIDIHKGVVNLGDNFVSEVIGKAIGEYIINGYKKKLDAQLRGKWMADFRDENTPYKSS